MVKLLAMVYSNFFVVLFLVGTIYDLILHQILEYIDYINRKKHGREIPPELADYIDDDRLDLIIRYEDAKYFLWVPRSIISTLFTLLFVLSGFYVSVFDFFWKLTQNTFFTSFMFYIVAAQLPGFVIDLPFSLWGEFKIEKKFGFSNMTAKLWIMDFLKSLALELILTAVITGVACLLIEYANSWWWLLLGVFYVVFSLVANIVYPMFIAPIFNKFTPVEGELKDVLTSLMDKAGFKSNGIFTMDASKRSNHSNAYFTGLGKSKRIVLYDTLVNTMSNEEIEAVLGHELGHYKKHHIVKRMVVMVPVIFLALYVVSFLVRYPSLYQGFGFDVSTEVDYRGEVVALPYVQFFGLLLLEIVFEGYATLLSLLSNTFSRKNEFEADSFSVTSVGGAEPLVNALIKLNKENLSEINPPHIYTVFKYSHPPLIERIKNARRVEKNCKCGKVMSDEI